MSDLISRQAVLDYPIRLDHYDEEHGNRHFVLGIESVMEYVEHLPSADRPTGEWIDADGNKVRLDADGNPLDSCWCSNCGEWLVASDEHEVLGKFCPNCGARMGGEEE